MLSDRNGIKLDINNRKTTGKSPNIWKLIKTLLNNLRLKEMSPWK